MDADDPVPAEAEVLMLALHHAPRSVIVALAFVAMAAPEAVSVTFACSPID